MFARVIPLLKTPTGVNGFDYRIPEGLSLEPGDLVVVPFRKQRLVGVVSERMATSPFAAKAASILHRYGEVRFPTSFLALLAWTAERTFSSQPTVLHAWLRALPKRPADGAFQPTISAEQKTSHILTHWTATPQQELLERVRVLQETKKRILIVTPWKTRVDRIHSHIPGSLCLQSDQNMGDYATTWQRFIQNEEGVLVTTRIGAWLMCLADETLIDEPENDDHKQDDLTPRYDVRKLAAWFATTQKGSLETFGITPALHVQVPAPLIPAEVRVFIQHPQGRSQIPCIQADTLQAFVDHEGPRVIIHPIRGVLARLVCRDCGWQAICPTCNYPLALEEHGALCRLCHKHIPLSSDCPHCGSLDLGKSFPGIDRLKQAWTRIYPEIEVTWRDLTNEQMDAPFAPNTFVLVTLTSLLGGAVEDIRRHERQCVAIRRLAARVAEAKGVLALQGEELEVTRWLSWLTPEGVQALFEQERASRLLFRYPPSVRRAKLLLDIPESEANTFITSLLKILPPTISSDGPFHVQYGTPGQRKRLVYHLIVPADVPEAQLIHLLSPFAKQIKIDLDPIAFFK